VLAPIDFPAIANSAGKRGATPLSRKCSRDSTWCSRRRLSTWGARMESCARSDASQAARSSSFIPNAASKYGLSFRHQSGLRVDIIASQGLRRTEIAVQINARLLPFSLHRALGYAPHGSNFSEGETAEEPQVDNLRERGIRFGQLVQGIADGRESLVVGKFFCRSGS